MRWEAANVARRPEESNQESASDVFEASNAPRQRLTETGEAALARLTKSYSAAIKCVGALHKANSAFQAAQAKGALSIEESSRNSEFSTNDTKGQLQRVADAARSALEQGVLLDPLIRDHVPTLYETILDLSTDSTGTQERWELSQKSSRCDPPVLTSSAHRSAVSRIAYLSLVNYGDLLLSACSCSAATAHGKKSNPVSVLDRGIVDKLQVLMGDGPCCWRGENEEDTQRLALVAFCDATRLQESDPTLWLRLACSARGLNNTLSLCRANDELITDSAYMLRRYRRLERHALERGRLALPQFLPPNRTVVRALAELNSTGYPETYSTKLEGPVDCAELELDLPRYSWPILGRILLKAAKEGAAYRSTREKVSSHKRRQLIKAEAFGSPKISLRISPMLTVPSFVLGKICQFLTGDSIWRFEATCRALSVSIISARASMEQESQTKNKRQKQPVMSNIDFQVTGSKPEPAPDRRVETETVGITNVERRTSSHRTSKRVRSQLITSGKLAERSARRNSVEFCFLAAVLVTVVEDDTYVALLKEEVNWDSLIPAQDLASGRIQSFLQGDTTTDKGYEVGSEKKLQNRHRKEARERSGEASLTTFVKESRSRGIGPSDLLSRFITHIARHVEDVFAIDPGGMTTLASCFTDSIDFQSKLSGFNSSLLPSWYGSNIDAVSIDQFATNLLNAELRFKRCERLFADNGYDDDANMVSAVVPLLLRIAEDVTRFENEEARIWAALKARTHWLAAGFFLWRSRTSHTVSESRMAESLGLEHVETVINCLGSPAQCPINVVLTPHLESPVRTEPHWKVLSIPLLSAFRDEAQASSIVSLARQQFLAVLARFDQDVNDAFSEEDTTKLGLIGKQLLRRYDVPYEGRGGKHEELVDDFRATHSRELSALNWDEYRILDRSESRWNILSDVVPSTGSSVLPSNLLEILNPSILTILVTCHNSKPGNGLPVALLLTRLVISMHDQQGFLAMQKIVQQDSSRERLKSSNYGSDDNEDFSDSDSELESDDPPAGPSSEHSRSRGEAEASKGRMLSLFAQFCLDKIAQICSSLSVEEKVQFVNNEDFTCMLHSSMAFSAEWYHRSMHKSRVEDEGVPLDLQVLVSLRQLVIDVLCESLRKEQKRRLESAFFVGLARIIVSQRHIFPSLVRSHGDNRTGRALRQRLCISRAEYVGAVASEAARMLSTNLSSHTNGSMIPSFLTGSLCGNFSKHEDESSHTSGSAGGLVALIDAVLWFWKYGTSAESIGISRSLSIQITRNAFDRPIVEELLAPIASVIVGLCGAAATSIPYFSGSGSQTRLEMSLDESSRDPRLCLSEFFDSDASANDWLVSDDEDDGVKSKFANRDLLRTLCQAVQCVTLVFGAVSEKLIFFRGSYQMHSNVHGPLLPLVVARVLNHFSERLLSDFGSSREGLGKGKDVWAKEYPSGTRTTGTRLDSSLCRAYNYLHGFSLSNTTSHVNAGKDHAIAAAFHDDSTMQKYPPESEIAAGQLYRCIMRAYAQGRKSPPKAALECVLSALPAVEENEKSKAIRMFLFSAENSLFDSKDVAKLVKKGSNMDSLMESLPVWASNGQASSTGDGIRDSAEKESLLVRKGVCRELAKGTLPQLSSASNDPTNCKGDDTKDAEERELAASHERDLYKKFTRILDYLCFAESDSCQGWYRAGQCLLMKSELIADRLGFSKGFARADDFSSAGHRSVENIDVGLADLEAEQERDFERKQQGWLPFLGTDLSTYVRYPWSKFSSLRSCSAEIEQAVKEQRNVCERTEDGSAAIYFHVWGEIEALYQREKYMAWQEAWGGMFVTALRRIATRCLCIAFCLAVKQSEDVSQDGDTIISEISESLGTAYYSMLMGSQMYGYPMHPMTAHHKRQLAETAKACYRHAADAVSLSGNQDEEEGRQTWDLLFMIGKCHEKIANSYKRERYPSVQPVADHCRQYEHQMNQAVKNYTVAMKEAKGIEEDGGFADTQAGGSEHGAVEVFYRLHALRLKCLIFAVQQKRSVRHLAESEALRIASRQWYVPPTNEKTWNSDELGVRETVWAVLADVVAALAQCRLDHSHFHRSVYRHAQALMWAHTLHNPDEKVENGLGLVPATKSCQIRGLNSATPCANSAEVVMGSLFEKKRPQLCAVWVTTPSSPPSPFPFLNNSIRKYDSLRGKYLSAYVDCLRLCQRTSKLESLLQWALSCKRDLPAFFRASAMSKGGTPASPHTRDRLLFKGSSLDSHGLLQTVKRQTNSAIATTVVLGLSDLQPTKKDQAPVEEHLKTAYACFLHLNCSVDDLERSRAWKFACGTIVEVDALCQAFLAMKDHKDVHTQEQSWSAGAQKMAVLKAALEKCQQQFPGFPSSIHSKNYRKRKRGQHSKGDVRASQEKDNMEKPKGGRHSTSPSPCVVSVPEGLVEGDTFETSIRVGDVLKQVKLLVPPGRPSLLKFSLTKCKKKDKD